MSGTKDKDNLAPPLSIVQKPKIGFDFEECNDSLHEHTRKAEQKLKAQKDSQGDVKPKETKK